MATVAQRKKEADSRRHSTVYHKRDSRLNDILRRCKKSEIINIYNIDAMMLFRVDSAHVQFDMLENHRPYILMHGWTEGVYLPAKSGLLFPNSCDQLDFRTDKRVDVSITYALSDVEIATLANNGLYHNDYSCQGRVIGSRLEIPCKVDYNAIVNTPITFIEIQDRLSLHTSTRKTGYKTLIAAFLPYDAQQHNLEEQAVITKPEAYNRDRSEIRKRALYDTKPLNFEAPPLGRSLAEGASFIEVAQDRIQQRLQVQMQKANILDIDVAETSQQITDAVKSIKEQTDNAKKKTLFDMEHNANKVDIAVLDARLHDMSNRMVYAGAQEIPLKVEPIGAKTLAEKKPVNQNDTIMTDPLTHVTTTAESIERKNNFDAKSAKDTVLDTDDKIRQGMFDAEGIANDVVKKTLTRKEKLQQRRLDRLRAQQRMIDAGEDEATKGLTVREPDVHVEIKQADGKKTKLAKYTTTSADKNDILSNDIDVDDIIASIGGGN